MQSPFGFLIINKPAGLTSHDCVNVIRRAFNIKRVGHGGTLDPTVTGVLPIAIGSATRLFPYLPKTKEYKAIIQLGLRTSTDDLEGEILSKQEWAPIKESDLEIHLEAFRGKILQQPPIISSVHFQGERSYKRARRGEIFDLPKKTITIFELNLLKWNPNNGQIEINVSCSAGTYIRALARDLGNSLNCGGCLANLHRTQAQGFTDNQTISLKTIKESTSSKKPNLINPIEGLTHLPKKIISSQEELTRWRKGQNLNLSTDKYNLNTKNTINKVDKIVLVINERNQIEGVGDYSVPFTIKPKVVFNAIG